MVVSSNEILNTQMWSAKNEHLVPIGGGNG
jgi:hypothetical protein